MRSVLPGEPAVDSQNDPGTAQRRTDPFPIEISGPCDSATSVERNLDPPELVRVDDKREFINRRYQIGIDLLSINLKIISEIALQLGNANDAVTSQFDLPHTVYFDSSCRNEIISFISYTSLSLLSTNNTTSAPPLPISSRFERNILPVVRSSATDP